MNGQRATSIILFVCTACMLAACGGGNSGPGPAPVSAPAPALAPTVVVSAPPQQAASVYISAPATGGVYVAAHPDDVELMMAPNAAASIRSGNTTVVVLLSAGDAGNLAAADAKTGLHQYNKLGQPYYRVRLNAHEAALSTFLAAPVPVALRASEYFSAAAPAVEKVTIGKLTLYHLNLPDSRLDALVTGTVLTLRDVTGNNYYTAEGMRATLRQIISRNFSSTPTITVHFPEPDLSYFQSGYNEPMADGRRPTERHRDHPDHISTGKFVQAAIGEEAAYGCLAQAIFMGYGVQAVAANLGTLDQQRQRDAYDTLQDVLVKQGNVTYDPSILGEQEGSDDAFHRAFLGRVMWRAQGPAAAAACSF